MSLHWLHPSRDALRIATLLAACAAIAVAAFITIVALSPGLDRRPLHQSLATALHPMAAPVVLEVPDARFVLVAVHGDGPSARAVVQDSLTERSQEVAEGDRIDGLAVGEISASAIVIDGVSYLLAAAP